MKNSILIILAGLLTTNILSSQNEITLSKLEQKEINGITTYLLNGKKFDGIIYENYSDNKPKVKFQIIDGVREGVSEMYYQNGQLLERLLYKNGLKEGP